jgi:hypothetical protein
MSKFNKILLSLFVVQLLLTAGIFFGEHSGADKHTQMALLDVDQAQIDHITIDNGQGKQAVLVKVNGQWQLPDYHQLPADQATVNKALQALANTHSGWPVATTTSSHQRFKVDDDKYQIRITLAKGDEKLEPIYLGTSPGFRQIHVRKEGQDAVYNVKLNSYDYSVSNKYWLDHKLLSPGKAIASIEGPDYSLNKQGDDWQTSDNKGTVVKAEADKLINALTALNVREAVEEKPQQVAYQLKVRANGKSYDYRFFSKDKDYFVSRDDYAQAFKINKADFDKITGLKATQLVKLGDKEAGNPATAGKAPPEEKKHT